MENAKYFVDQLLRITPENFAEEALKLFRFQALHNPIYSKYLHYLQVDPTSVTDISAIPFLPISFFKTQQVMIPQDQPVQAVFESSGTTGEQRSQHFVADIEMYYRASASFFEQIYGRLSDFHVFALLPSYLERKNASLVVMADHFIKRSNSPHSGFYLNNYKALMHEIEQARQSRKVILIGVSFALLDLAEQYQPDFSDIIVMETGGMKGRRKELTRSELHEMLQEKFHTDHIHSEYGMTELLSQAYAKQEGRFHLPPWMKILIRDVNDPFDVHTSQKTGLSRPGLARPAADPAGFATAGPSRPGGINVVDMANIYSCAFIETQDLGKLSSTDDTFEVLGRFDNSDVRGCNLMVN